MNTDSLCILVVDDERLIRETLAELLSRTSHTVATAADGQAAIDYLRANSVDLVFTDVVMPRATGDQVLESARALPCPPVVIVMTGKDLDIGPAEFMASGAYAYLRKPYPMAEILRLTQEVATQRAQQVVA